MRRALFVVLIAAGCPEPLEPLESTEPEPPPPPPVLVESCGVMQARQSNVAPLILLALDKSGSMALAADGQSSRWQAATEAAISMAAAHETELAFGLMLFPSPLSRDGCAAGEVIVEPRLGTADEIAEVLDPQWVEPDGATPTAATLRAARTALAGNVDGVPAAVVLATDGGPNCNGNLDPETCLCAAPDQCGFGGNPANICLDVADTVQASADLLLSGIPTYVVGITGADEFGFVLDDVARAGGTARAGFETNYYPAGDADELGAALEDVRLRVEKCQRTVEVALGDDADVSVTVNGQQLDRGEDDGFEVANGKIVLRGDACDRAIAEDIAVDVEVCRLVPVDELPVQTTTTAR